MLAQTDRPQGFDLMDDASAALILQMQNADLEELLTGSKGKAREGEASDADLALALFQEDLRDMSGRVADRVMSRSMTRAVIMDGSLLSGPMQEEQRAANDRAMAQRLSDDRAGDVEDVNERKSSSMMEESLSARLFDLYITPLKESDADSINYDAEDNDEQLTSESSSWAASRQAHSATSLHECVSCGTSKRLFELLGCPCEHYYCEDCLRTLFRLSLSDETLFPPRCCRQQIPLSFARLYLDSGFVESFRKKSAEFMSSDRTYCYRPTCSSFIPSQYINGDSGICPDCGQLTCIICKGRSHEGDCPQDTGVQQVLELANEQGWQRCYNCRRLVELNHGCNHMRYAVLDPIARHTNLTLV